MCSHDPIFGTNYNRILKNVSYEQAFTGYLALKCVNKDNKMHQYVFVRGMKVKASLAAAP